MKELKLLLKLIELCDLFAFKTAIGDRRKSVVPRTTRNNVALLLFAIAATFCLYFFVLDAISLAKLRIYGSLVVIYTAIYVGKVLALVFAAICLKKDAVRLWSGVLELREYRLPNRPRIWWNLLAVLLLRLSVVLAAAKTNYEFKAGIAVIMCSAMFALVESLSMLTFLKLQALLCLFGGYFRALNANIGEAVTRGNTLRDVAVLHQKLYDLTVALNKNFAAILLVDFAESFVLFIVHVYSVITGLVNNYTWFPTESSVFCTTLAVSRVYSVVVLAEYCSGEGNSANETLLKLLAAVKDDASARQMRVFSLQLLHCDVEISSAKVFALKYSTIFAIAGACTTYLVILMQFTD